MIINTTNYLMTMICYSDYARVKITLFDGVRDVDEAKFNCTYNSYLYNILKDLQDDTEHAERTLNHVYNMMYHKYRIVKHDFRIRVINS